MGQDRLEQVQEQMNLFKTTNSAIGFNSIASELLLNHGEWLIEQAKHISMYEDAAERANAVIEEINEENLALKGRVLELERENEEETDKISRLLTINHEDSAQTITLLQLHQRLVEHFNKIQKENTELHKENNHWQEVIEQAKEMARSNAISSAACSDIEVVLSKALEELK